MAPRRLKGLELRVGSLVPLRRPRSLTFMKLYRSRILLCSALGFAIATAGAAQKPPTRRGGPPPPPAAQAAQRGVSTTVSGAISQFNYNRDAEIEGFLLSNKTLVHLPRRAASYIGSSMHVGDTVQVTGYAQTSAAGVQTIDAQSVQDRTSGKAITVPEPGAAAPYSGSGRIQQLNYGPDGAINGFVFDNGTLATVPPFSATNPSSLRVGATVGYSGYARNTMSGRTVVDVQTLTINGQPLSLNLVGRGTPPPPRAGTRGGPGTPPPPPAPSGATPPAPAPAPASGPAPAGRTDQPTPPPAPAAQPPRS